MIYQEILEKENIVYSDGWAKGYPLWTESGINLQDTCMRILINEFSNDYRIHLSYPDLFADLEEFLDLYNKQLNKFDETFPIIQLGDKDKIMKTDMLPYNLKTMEQQEIDFLFSCYQIIRLLKVKKKPLYRDYFISPVVQINLCLHGRNIFYVLEKSCHFFRKINIPTIVLECEGVYGYSNAVYFLCTENKKDELVSLMQISILSVELLRQFYLTHPMWEDDIIDLGHSQKIYACFAECNADEYGIHYPEVFGKNDIVVIYNSKVKHDLIYQINNNRKMEYCGDLGIRKLKAIRRYYLSKGFRTLIIHRYDGKYESLHMQRIDGIDEVMEIGRINQLLRTNCVDVNRHYYQRSNQKLERYLGKRQVYINELKKWGKVVAIDL